ncbi:unnamed protein product [marine sediment metagenome]|uniref:Uncharacterized protein n=1 Tax=marine sediment metagenome TaxID=412755 RepID=X1KDD4_9ZZZZ
MLDSLNKLFNSIELTWIDSITNIDESDEFTNLFINISKFEENFSRSSRKE